MKNSLEMDLANEIVLALKKEFQEKHLSKNLIETMYVVDLGDYIEIHIPAPTYNMYQYFMNGKVVIPNGKGSYASRLDIEGSAFMAYWGKKSNPNRKLIEPHNHVGYLSKCINEGISNWVGKDNLKIRME